MKTIIATALLALALTACGTQTAANHSRECLEMGFPKGTASHLECVKLMEQHHAEKQARYVRARRALGQSLMNYGNALQNQPSNRQRCYVNGNMIQCY